MLENVKIVTTRPGLPYSPKILVGMCRGKTKKRGLRIELERKNAGLRSEPGELKRENVGLRNGL